MAKTLVIGASGTVGNPLVKALAERGHSVLKATSRPVTDPATEVHLNLVTQSGLVTALDGVDRAFVLTPAGYTNQDQLLKPVIDAAKAKGLEKLVLMTVIGANADESTPLRKAEAHLQNSGLAYNIIRPIWFMQNFNTYWLQGIVQGDTIALPVAQAKGSFIDVRDIVDVAAQLLSSDHLRNQEFDLTGGAAFNLDEVAALLSATAGRTIHFQDITSEAMLAGLLGSGVPRPYAEFLVMSLGLFKAGHSEPITDAVSNILGRAPRTLQQYVQDYRGAWVKAA